MLTMLLIAAVKSAKSGSVGLRVSFKGNLWTFTLSLQTKPEVLCFRVSLQHAYSKVSQGGDLLHTQTHVEQISVTWKAGWSPSDPFSTTPTSEVSEGQYGL